MILPAPGPTIVKSSKERIRTFLRTTWIDSGTEQWQIPRTSTGRSRVADPKSRSEHILKTFLCYRIQRKSSSRCKEPNDHKTTDSRNSTNVGLPTS